MQLARRSSNFLEFSGCVSPRRNYNNSWPICMPRSIFLRDASDPSMQSEWIMRRFRARRTQQDMEEEARTLIGVSFLRDRFQTPFLRLHFFSIFCFVFFGFSFGSWGGCYTPILALDWLVPLSGWCVSGWTVFGSIVIIFSSINIDVPLQLGHGFL